MFQIIEQVLMFVHKKRASHGKGGVMEYWTALWVGHWFEGVED